MIEFDLLDDFICHFPANLKVKQFYDRLDKYQLIETIGYLKRGKIYSYCRSKLECCYPELFI